MDSQFKFTPLKSGKIRPTDYPSPPVRNVARGVARRERPSSDDEDVPFLVAPPGRVSEGAEGQTVWASAQKRIRWSLAMTTELEGHLERKVPVREIARLMGLAVKNIENKLHVKRPNIRKGLI